MTRAEIISMVNVNAVINSGGIALDLFSRDGLEVIERIQRIENNQKNGVLDWANQMAPIYYLKKQDETLFDYHCN